MTVMAGSPGAGARPAPAEELKPTTLSGKMLIGRDEGRVQIHLAHPQVSRIHAHISHAERPGDPGRSQQRQRNLP